MKKQWYLNNDGTLSDAAYEAAFEYRKDKKLHGHRDNLFMQTLALLRRVRAAGMVC